VQVRVMSAVNHSAFITYYDSFLDNGESAQRTLVSATALQRRPCSALLLRCGRSSWRVYLLFLFQVVSTL
jgi:hypothetical protein